jgi:hypothetical protein
MTCPCQLTIGNAVPSALYLRQIPLSLLHAARSIQVLLCQLCDLCHDFLSFRINEKTCESSCTGSRSVTCGSPIDPIKLSTLSANRAKSGRDTVALKLSSVSPVACCNSHLVPARRLSVSLQVWWHDCWGNTFRTGASADESSMVGVEETHPRARRQAPDQHSEIHIQVRVPHGLRPGKAVGPRGVTAILPANTIRREQRVFHRKPPRPW